MERRLKTGREDSDVEIVTSELLLVAIGKKNLCGLAVGMQKCSTTPAWML